MHVLGEVGTYVNTASLVVAYIATLGLLVVASFPVRLTFDS